MELLGEDQASDDYDSPWKEAVERYFPEFMGFYFPAAAAQIDWAKGYEFLDQELRAVVQDAELGTKPLVLGERVRAGVVGGCGVVGGEFDGCVWPDAALIDSQEGKCIV